MSIVDLLWQHVFSMMQEGVVITDVNARILYVNRAVMQLTGYQEEELLGNNPNLLSSGRQNRRFYQRMWQSLMTSGYWQGEVVNRRKDGGCYTELLTITSVKGEDGVPRHYIGLFYDICERKRLSCWLAESGDFLAMPEPYESLEQELLRRIQPIIDANIPNCIEDFTRELRGRTQEKKSFPNINFSEQADFLRFLLNPDSTRDDIVVHAKIIGVRHALMGVQIHSIPNTVFHHIHYFARILRTAAVSTRDYYWLAHIIETRLHDIMIAQLEAMDSVMDQYLQAVAAGHLQEGTWADIKKHELDMIVNLPGMFGAMLIYPNAGEDLTVELTAGEGANTLLSIMDNPASIDTGVLAVAARTRQIVSSPNILNDEFEPRWWRLAKTVEVRSGIAIPIVYQNTNQIMILVLCGRFENQFESAWMKIFANHLQRRWQHLWQQYDRYTQMIVISQNQANDYRKRLFSGGLVMYCQPIISLDTGKLLKVEMLARLAMPDGTLVLPSFFLPLLENEELDRLFQLGLEQAATYIVEWEKQGLSIGVSVNLSPLTLLNPSCVTWVKYVLERYRLPAEKLTLELLETQDIDQTTQNEAILRLKKLGVKLAVDDLGSGYSSLLRLIRLPFDVVKIEQGLLFNLSKEPIAILHLIYGLIQIGRGLGKEVVVEGVENPGIIEAMMVFKAAMGQGYGLARPMPADRIKEWADHFQSPAVPGEIHTYAGALAYYWRFVQHDHFTTVISIGECPMTRFMMEKGLQNEEIADWHTLVHENVELKSNSQKILAWLEKKVREELLFEK